MKGNLLNFVSHCNVKTIEDCIVKEAKIKKEDVCEWIKQEEIGRGVKGVAYSACCDKNCDYIIKVVKFDKKNKKTEIERFINEAENQQKYYKIDMAPRVVVACYCDHEGVILMEKVQLLRDYLATKKDEDLEELKKKYLEKYKKAIETTGIIQNDTNPDNIAISLDGRKPMLIDFGISRKLKSDDDIKEIIDDFAMSIVSVFKGKKATVVEQDRKPKAKSRIQRYSSSEDESSSESDDIGLSSFDSDEDDFSVPRYSPQRKKKSKPMIYESEDDMPLFESAKKPKRLDDSPRQKKKTKPVKKPMFDSDSDDDMPLAKKNLGLNFKEI